MAPPAPQNFEFFSVKKEFENNLTGEETSI
jgi:hypothetical protein